MNDNVIVAAYRDCSLPLMRQPPMMVLLDDTISR
jgi:hypothetical protein